MFLNFDGRDTEPTSAPLVFILLKIYGPFSTKKFQGHIPQKWKENKVHFSPQFTFFTTFRGYLVFMFRCGSYERLRDFDLKYSAFRSRGDSCHQRILLLDLRRHRRLGIHFWQCDARSHWKSNPSFWSNSIPIVNGAPSTKEFSAAFESHDVHSNAWWCLHDHEIPVQFTHLSHDSQYFSAVAKSISGDHYSQSAFRSQQMEHQLCRYVFH